jgi:hypothetical protein
MSAADPEASDFGLKRIVIEAGFKKEFVDQAFSVPNSEIWEPSAEILAAADVITGMADGTQFAMSGFSGDVTRERMAKFLAQTMPLVLALKDTLPKDYDEITRTYYDDYIAGKTENTSLAGARTKTLASISALRPLDDPVLADMAAVLADEYTALGAKSPTLCYFYTSKRGVNENFATDLRHSLVVRQNEMNRSAIETTKKSEEAKVLADVWKKLERQLAAKDVGISQQKLLTARSIDRSKFGEYCRTLQMYYREIGRLPAREAGILMRSILTNK